MRISIAGFRGEAPIVADRLLPDGAASTAVNARLVSGDLDSFVDIGNPFQLAKAAPIGAVWLMAGPAPDFWLQWQADEVAYGGGIDVSLGTVPGDASNRCFITGLAGGPQQTNLFYATDPSQQGSSAAGAYPYTVFPLGIAGPQVAPTAVGPSAPAGPTTEYGYAAEASVNNALIRSGGTGYRMDDVLTTNQGTIAPGLHGAQIKVTAVDTAGVVTGITLQSGGFFRAGLGPPAVGATVMGGGGSGATFDLTVVPNSFDGFATYEHDNGAGYYQHWTIANNMWQVSSGQGSLTVAYSQTIFGVGSCGQFTFQSDQQTTDSGSGTVPDLVTYLCGVYTGGRYISGPALVLSQLDGTFTLYSDMQDTEPFTATQVAQASVATAVDTKYRVMVTAVAASGNSSTKGFSVTATLAAQSAPGAVLATVSGFVPDTGESFGVGTQHRGPGDDGNLGYFENIRVTVSQPADQATSESTAYVYTYVTQYGSDDNRIMQESGPSDPSETVTFFLDGSTSPVTMTPVSVSIPPAPPGKNIVSYNLYRLVQTANGEVFEFVLQLTADPVNAVVFPDNVLDSALGDALLSADWQPPPSDLQGILALPNGVMAGFFANTLCLSARNFPFAWPVDNQLPTDTPIVAIAAIDSTVLVLTTAHPYTAWGSDPAAYSMSKETANQGCVSRRSAATHKRLGVVYASGNGLCYYRGQGDLDLIRMPGGDPYFSVEQWQALNPASILGVVHDDKYWWWYEAVDGRRGGYVLDLSPAGFGLVELDFHVTAAYVDPATDTLYFTPDFSLYPVNGTVLGSALNVLSQWEGGSGARARSWERDDFLLSRPACFSMARVRGADYADLQLRVSCENGTAFDGAVTGSGPFVMAPVVGVRWNVALLGASTVNTVEIVEGGGEFGTP